MWRVLAGTRPSGDHLKLYAAAALREGSTREELLEVVMQGVVSVGFMRALSALLAVKEVLEEMNGAIGGGEATGTGEPPKEKRSGK